MSYRFRKYWPRWLELFKPYIFLQFLVDLPAFMDWIRVEFRGLFCSIPGSAFITCGAVIRLKPLAIHFSTDPTTIFAVAPFNLGTSGCFTDRGRELNFGSGGFCWHNAAKVSEWVDALRLCMERELQPPKRRRRLGSVAYPPDCLLPHSDATPFWVIPFRVMLFRDVAFVIRELVPFSPFLSVLWESSFIPRYCHVPLVQKHSRIPIHATQEVQVKAAQLRTLNRSRVGWRNSCLALRVESETAVRLSDGGAFKSGLLWGK